MIDIENKKRKLRSAYFSDNVFVEIEKDLTKAKSEYIKNLTEVSNNIVCINKEIGRKEIELKRWKEKKYKPTSLEFKSKIATKFSKAKDINERRKKENIDILNNELYKLKQNLSAQKCLQYELKCILSMF
jgi:hypothetical protein